MPGLGCYVKISPQYITDKELIGSNITIVEYENELSYTIEEGENIQNTITTLGCEGYSVTNKGDMMVLSFPQNAKVTLE
jgi:RNase P/RNase MRP subunit p29